MTVESSSVFFKSVATVGFVEQPPFGILPSVFELAPGQAVFMEVSDEALACISASSWLVVAVYSAACVISFASVFVTQISIPRSQP